MRPEPRELARDWPIVPGDAVILELGGGGYTPARVVRVNRRSLTVEVPGGTRRVPWRLVRALAHGGTRAGT